MKYWIRPCLCVHHKEGWAPKNWCFQIVVLEKILESHLDSKEMKPVSPKGNELQGLMLKLKLQYFGHLMRRADTLEKTLILGKSEGRRKRGRQRMRWLDGLTDSMTWVWANSGRWWRTGEPRVLQSIGWQRIRHDWRTKQQNKTLCQPGLWGSRWAKSVHDRIRCSFLIEKQKIIVKVLRAQTQSQKAGGFYKTMFLSSMRTNK